MYRWAARHSPRGPSPAAGSSSSEARARPQLLWKHDAAVTAIAIERDRIATAAADGSIRAGTRDAKVPRALDAHAGAVGGLRWLDGDLLSCGADGRVLRWDVEAGALRADHRVGDDPVTALDIGPDGAAWAGWASGRIESPYIQESEQAPIANMLVTPRGFWASTEGHRILRTIETGRTARLGESWSLVSGLAMTPDGVTALHRDGHLSVGLDRLQPSDWGNELLHARPDSPLTSDGELIAWIHRDGRPRLGIHTPDGAPLPGHPGRARCLDVFDGLVLSGTDDGALVLQGLFGAPPGPRLHLPNAHTAPVTGCRILDRDTLVSCSLDGTVRAWGASGEALATFWGTAAFTTLTASRNAHRPIVAGDWEGRLWTLELRGLDPSDPPP